MAKQSKGTLFVNTLGVLGYMSLCVQWLWTGVAIIPALFENQSVRNLFIPDPSRIPTSPVPTDEALSPLMLIIAMAVTAVVMIISIVILIRLPVAIAKTGKKTVYSTAEAIIPVITHHQKLPPKKKKFLTFELVKLIKFVACVLPMIILLVSVQIARSQLEDEVLLALGAAFAIGSLVWFTLEYVFARLLKVPIDDVL